MNGDKLLEYGANKRPRQSASSTGRLFREVHRGRTRGENANRDTSGQRTPAWVTPRRTEFHFDCSKEAVLVGRGRPIRTPQKGLKILKPSRFFPSLSSVPGPLPFATPRAPAGITLIEGWAREHGGGVYSEDRRHGTLERVEGIVAQVISFGHKTQQRRTTMFPTRPLHGGL